MPTPDLQSIADLIYGAGAPAVSAPPDAVSGADPVLEGAQAMTGPANVDPYATQVDFQPKTYDFGNHAAQNYTYDQQGNLQEQLPGSVSVGVKQGDRGYSPEKMAQIEAGPMGSGQMAKKKQSAVDAIQSRYAPIKSEMNSANQEQLAAEDNTGQAESQAILARGQASNDVATMMTTHAHEIERLSHDAILAKQAAADEYRQKLLEIGEVNPNALWDDAGTGGQIALAGAAILHEMLNVKGIKTSAMDTINSAIKNKIDAQIANINKQKSVASGFKDLYEMTVAESASQMEVKTKLQGYYLKAMENQIDATLAPYDSNVARAKRSQAKAVIRQAQLKNMAEVESHIGREIDQAYGREIAIRGQNIQASIAQKNREADLKVAELRAGADKGAAKGPPVIYDTSKSGKGAAKWRVKPQYADDKEMQRDLIKKTVFTNKAVDGMRELIDLQEKIKGSPPALAGRLRNELARREEALRGVVVSALILDLSGKAATEGEQERIAKQVPERGWFTNGDNRKIISQRVAEKTKEMNDYLAQTTDALKEGDPEYGTSASTNEARYGEGEAIDAAASLNPSDKPRTTQLLETAQAPDALDDYSVKGNVSRSVEFKQYTKPYWDAFRKEYPQIAPDRKTVPKAFDAVRELAEEAHGGDQDAAGKLQALSIVSPDGSRNSNAVEVRSMAKFFLEKIGKPGVPGTEGASGFGIETDQAEDSKGDRAGDESDAGGPNANYNWSKVKQLEAKRRGAF